MNNYEKIKNIKNIDEMINVLNFVHFLIFMGAGAFNLKQWLESEKEGE